MQSRRSELVAIFDACYRRFRECATMPKHLSQATLERSRGKNATWAWVRPHENYIADFAAIAKRTLGPLEYRIFCVRSSGVAHFDSNSSFAAHFLHGADASLCCRLFAVNMPTLNAALDHIRCVLGQAFAETQPFPLFPPAAYFSSPAVPVHATATPAARQFVPVRPPLAPAA